MMMRIGLLLIFLGILFTYIVPFVSLFLTDSPESSSKSESMVGIIFIGMLMNIMGFIICLVKYYG